MTKEPIIRCMGNPKNRETCKTCKRLPRKAIDEMEVTWYKWQDRPTPCDKLLPK